ncbi:MAG: hypothetical protein FJ125_14575 [Deltaproteobacteria bacterium]|nr:hypothetical protein [Deltaproteobacteria bacterium]
MSAKQSRSPLAPRTSARGRAAYRWAAGILVVFGTPLCSCLGPYAPPDHGPARPGKDAQPSAEDGGSEVLDIGSAAIPDTPPADEGPTPADLGGPAGFCHGEPHVARKDGKLLPVQVTTSQLVMGCCEGIIVRLHDPALPGSLVSLMVSWAALSAPAGPHDLSGITAQIEVSAGDGTFAHQPVMQGTLTLSDSYPPLGPDPLYVEICAEILGDPLPGSITRLWLPTQVIPWSWAARFGIWPLADPDLSAEEADRLPLTDLPLAIDPLFDLMGVAWYDQTTTTFHLDPWRSWVTTRLPEVGFYGLPLVLVVDGERLGLIALHSQLSSYAFPGTTVWLEALAPGVLPLTPGPSALAHDRQLLTLLRSAAKLVGPLP